MKALLSLVFATQLMVPAISAADLPTVSIEHLYYLQSRAERVGKLKPEQLVDYCIAQKLGSSSFESLYTQLFSMRIDVTKLTKVEEVPPGDPRIVTLTRTIDAYTTLLYDEARRVQNGILREGEVATDTLVAIAKVQRQQ